MPHNNDDDEDSEDEGKQQQEFFTGGEKSCVLCSFGAEGNGTLTRIEGFGVADSSGLSVQNPNAGKGREAGDMIKGILQKAKE